MAVANRMPCDDGAQGLGTTVSLRYVPESFVVSVERYRNVGGYGKTLSREETFCESLEAALLHIGTYGFSPDQLRLMTAD